MEIIDYDHLIHGGRKLIVYGSGAMRDITAYCLNTLGIPVYYYANRTASNHIVYGNIISVEAMLEIYKNEDVLILFAIANYARWEAEDLCQKGITRVYSIRKLWCEIREIGAVADEWDDYKKRLFYYEADRLFFTEDMIANPQELYLYSLDAVVTERCSLKCRDCSNLMQYYQCPQNMDVNVLKKSLDIILSKVYRIFELVILGGEPFINQDFIKLINWYKDEPKIERISIYSNATIFPSEDVLECLKVQKIFIRMSDYGVLSGKLTKWIQWCTDNHVRYEVVKMKRWHDCGKLERHDYNEQELLAVYAECECRNLPTVIGDYLYNCPYAANAANLGAMYSDEVNNDRLLLTERVSANDVNHFLYERKYLEACRYCKGRNFKQPAIEPYIQTKQPLEYKRLTEERAMSSAVFVNCPESQHLVSVIIPAFNQEKYIEHCLNSVLASSYKNLEIIVVDDGSSDGTVKLCKAVAATDLLKRIKVIENKHEGVVRARNAGILAAVGKYITFVDADDYIAHDRLENMIAAMNDCDLVHSGFLMLQENKAVPDELMDRGQGCIRMQRLDVPCGVYEGERLESYITNGITGGTTMTYVWSNIYRTDIMKSICEKVDPSIIYCEDDILIYIYMTRCKRINIIKDYGYYYRIYDNYNRYNLDGILANMERVFHCLCHEFEALPNAKTLKECLIQKLGDDIRTGIAMKFERDSGFHRIKRIYYPYYGRFRDKKIILYGAGNVGRAYYKHMKKDGECILVAWVDRNALTLNKDNYLPVEPIDCLYCMEYDYVIIAVFDEPVYEKIRAELIHTGIKEEKIIWNATRYEL